jgi:tetratricopeptide (TPR) repeat protein
MLQKDIATNGNSYSLASNVSALYLQLGDYQNAIYYSTQAIALDPYSHIAYFNRFLGYLSSGEREAGWRDLRRALSCLYLVRGVEE